MVMNMVMRDKGASRYFVGERLHQIF